MTGNTGSDERPGCGAVLLVMFIVSAIVFMATDQDKPSDSTIIQGWKQDSLDLQAWQLCRDKLPEAKLRQVVRRDLTMRIIMIRNEAQNTLVECTVDWGKIQSIDTAMLR